MSADTGGPHPLPARACLRFFLTEISAAGNHLLMRLFLTKRPDQERITARAQCGCEIQGQATGIKKEPAWKRDAFVAMIALLLCGCSSAPREPSHQQPQMLFGVYEPGHDLTEPRPRKSEYLETKSGGVLVLPDGAGLFLFTRVIKRPASELYITVEYENPQGGAPLTNDMRFETKAQEFGFSAPSLQPGLRRYATYTITVKIWEKKGAAQPIDTLVQKVRSYVDTTGPAPLLMSS